MKVLACGSRKWTNRRVIREWLQQFPSDTVVVHGDAVGADTIIDFEARKLGMTVRSYPAEWEAEAARGHRASAGPKRNSKMLREEHPDKTGIRFDICGAFSNNLDESRGTRDMVRKALNAGVPCEVVNETGGKELRAPV